MRPRYRLLPHTADERLLAWGADERELIANAVAGVVRLALGRPARWTAARWAPISPWPSSIERRIVRAANEALFVLYVRREAVVDVRFDGAGASLGLARLPDAIRPEVEIKAATFHDLRTSRRAGRLCAVLTLDL